MPNFANVSVDSGNTIYITGIMNSQVGWQEQIVVTPEPDTSISPVTWTGAGPHVNKIVGQLVIPSSDVVQLINIAMFYNEGGDTDFSGLERH